MSSSSEFSIPIDILNKIRVERKQERLRGFKKAIEIASGERGYQRINFVVKLYGMLNNATGDEQPEMTKNFAEVLSELGVNYQLETDEFIDGLIFGCKRILEESKKPREEAEKSSGYTYKPPSMEEIKKRVEETRRAGLLGTDRAGQW
ncbi:MAG: hypothetical protein ACUVTD_09460 [Nitrososphaerales archaeon]